MTGKVLIIDDVITAGTAIHEAVDIIRKLSAEPVGVVIAFDRQERGKSESTSAIEDVEQKIGIQVINIANISELIQYAESKQLYTEHLPKLKEYFEAYKCIPI